MPSFAFALRIVACLVDDSGTADIVQFVVVAFVPSHACHSMTVSCSFPWTMGLHNRIHATREDGWMGTHPLVCSCSPFFRGVCEAHVLGWTRPGGDCKCHFLEYKRWKVRRKNGAESHSSSKCRRSWRPTSTSMHVHRSAERPWTRVGGADGATCRELIGRINANHDSRDPERLQENVALIRELNGNISRVVEIYRHVSVDLQESMDKDSTHAS